MESNSFLKVGAMLNHDKYRIERYLASGGFECLFGKEMRHQGVLPEGYCYEEQTDHRCAYCHIRQQEGLKFPKREVYERGTAAEQP